MMTAVRQVLFYRDFRCLTGGHLKVWDYFNHVRSSPRHQAWALFSPGSVWDQENPWRQCREQVISHLPDDIDLWFVGGTDWLALDQLAPGRVGKRPVINLIQHLTHADPLNPRYQFLARPAVRICVSEEVAKAICATGRVNGPVFTIPNGLCLPDLGPLPKVRDIDMLVVANKAPAFGAQVATRLWIPGRRVLLVDRQLPRTEFLGLLTRARVTVFAPNLLEGFYLPALEGMALGTLVVSADCVGNRSFCLPGVNCLRPAFTEESVVCAAETALALEPAQAAQLTGQGLATATAHSLEAERQAFIQVLQDVDTLLRRCNE
jgi:glycosyltransferase involved in cell wall biosynthesis